MTTRRRAKSTGIIIVANLRDAAELQRAAEPDTESPKHVSVHASPPATNHTPSSAVIPTKTEKVSSYYTWATSKVSNTDCRWPLVFRFIKGAIHVEILLPVFLHAVFTAFVVYLDTYAFDTVGIPSSIVGIFCEPLEVLT